MDIPTLSNMDKDSDSSQYQYEDERLSNFSTPDSVSHVKCLTSSNKESLQIEEKNQKMLNEEEADSFQNMPPYENNYSILIEEFEEIDINNESQNQSEENQNHEPPEIPEIEISSIVLEESNTHGHYLNKEFLLNLQEIMDSTPIPEESVIEIKINQHPII